MKHRLLLALLGISVAANLAFLFAPQRSAESAGAAPRFEDADVRQKADPCTLLLGDSPEETLTRLRQAGLPSDLQRAVIVEQIKAKYRREYNSLIVRRDALRDPSRLFDVRQNVQESSRFESQLDALKARVSLEVRALLGLSSAESAYMAQFSKMGPEKHRQYLDTSDLVTIERAAEPGAANRSNTLMAEQRALSEGGLDLAFEGSKRRAKEILRHLDPNDAEAEIVRRFLADRAAVSQMPDFSEKNKALEQRLETELGSSRYSEFQKADNIDYQTLRDLCSVAQLPREKADQVWQLRALVSEESVRIMNDPTMNDAQTGEALKLLASKVRSAMLDALGKDVGPVFVKRGAFWLRNLEDGCTVVLPPRGFATWKVRKDAPPPKL